MRLATQLQHQLFDQQVRLQPLTEHLVEVGIVERFLTRFTRFGDLHDDDLVGATGRRQQERTDDITQLPLEGNTWNDPIYLVEEGTRSERHSVDNRYASPGYFSAMNLAILHGRYAGWFGDFGLAAGSVLGATAIVFSWYGVTFVLGVGLHSYGFGAGGQWEVGLGVALYWVFLAAAGARYLAETTRREPLA